MKIYKFGGASVKDAAGVRNVANIISQEKNNDILVVISAMGKTTNALETLVNAIFKNEKSASEVLQSIIQSHNELLDELFQENAFIWINEVRNLFLELECLIDNKLRDVLYFRQRRCAGFTRPRKRRVEKSGRATQHQFRQHSSQHHHQRNDNYKRQS